MRAQAAIPKRKLATFVELVLPMPLSVNAIWRSVGRGKVIRSSPYKKWQLEAGWELCQQRPGRIDGPYSLRIQACRRETKADLGNLEKVISDLLQHHGVIENDNLAEYIEMDWGADAGVRVTAIATESRSPSPMLEAAE